MALAKALKCCAEWSGTPPSTVCGTVQDLWTYLVPLIQLDEEDIWEASLFESVGEESMDSPTTAEDALPFSEDPEPQGVQASSLHIPIWPEEALKPKVTAGVVGPLNIQ